MPVFKSGKRHASLSGCFPSQTSPARTSRAPRPKNPTRQYGRTLCWLRCSCSVESPVPVSAAKRVGLVAGLGLLPPPVGAPQGAYFVAGLVYYARNYSGILPTIRCRACPPAVGTLRQKRARCPSSADAIKALVMRALIAENARQEIFYGQSERAGENDL